MNHSPFGKVEVPGFVEHVLGYVDSPELNEMDKVAELCSRAPHWAVEVLAWDRSMVLGQPSEAVEIILEYINRRS
jgi:hypothetical protein